MEAATETYGLLLMLFHIDFKINSITFKTE